MSCLAGSHWSRILLRLAAGSNILGETNFVKKEKNVHSAFTSRIFTVKNYSAFYSATINYI